VVLAGPAAAASQFQPDGLIRHSEASSYRGNGIYNETAVNQTVEARIGAQGVADFFVAIQNDGSVADTFRLNGSSHTTRFSVKYFIDGRDVSTRVKAAKHYVSLDSGEQEVLRVRIATRTSVPRGTTFKVDVRNRSNASGEVDVTRARVTRPLYSTAQLTVQSQINQTRSANGRAGLPMNRTLASKAQNWAQYLASIGRLVHSNLASGVPSGWEALAENVGYGPNLGVVHQAFLGSSGHRANILGPYNSVGTGVAWRGSLVYVVHVFMRS
jgi:uncharacterized protein YkwD